MMAFTQSLNGQDTGYGQKKKTWRDDASFLRHSRPHTPGGILREELTDLLTSQELAKWLKVHPKTIIKRIRKGIYRKNIHFVCPAGTRPLFIKAAIERWLREEDIQKQPETFPLSKEKAEAIRRGHYGLHNR